MATSRSSLQLLRRMGLLDASPRPNPRLDVEALLVHTTPEHPPKPSQAVLRSLEDVDPPDRGEARVWPGQTFETVEPE